MPLGSSSAHGGRPRGFLDGYSRRSRAGAGLRAGRSRASSLEAAKGSFDLLGGRQLASLNLGEPGQHIFKMLGIDVVRRAEPCEAEHGFSNCILIGRGKPTYGFDSLFEQLRHDVTFSLRVYHGSTRPVPCAM